MLVVKKITALIYNWNSLGTIEINSNIYSQENLENTIILHSLRFTGELEKDIIQNIPDIVVYEGELIKIDNSVLTEKCLQYTTFPTDEILANDIVTHVISKNCQQIVPIFSIFTTCFKSYEYIDTAYKSIKNQRLNDWEWVIMDDTPEDKHFDFLRQKLSHDNRVRLYKRDKNSGNIGNVKNEVISLCRGKYVLEMDHDDEILENCLLDAYNIFQTDDEIGFVYGDTIHLYRNNDNYKYNDWTFPRDSRASGVYNIFE